MNIALCWAAIVLFFTQCVKDSVPSKLSAIVTSSVTITLPQDSVELDGSKSKDLDGEPITYKWSYIKNNTSTVAPVIRTDTAAKTIIANLTQAGTYSFKLTVTNPRSKESAEAIVTITVNPKSPITITLSPASQMKKIPIGMEAPPILEASGNSSSGANIVSYSWSNESRPTGTAAPTITNPNNASTTVTGINNTVAGTYTFKVILKDASGNVGTATASITTSNAEPNIIGDFRGYYSGDSKNTFRFNITPDTANTIVDIVIGGSTSYDNNKTTYTYAPGVFGAVDTLKNCSFKITALDGSTSTTSFMGVFSEDHETLTIKDLKLGAGLSSMSDFNLKKQPK